MPRQVAFLPCRGAVIDSEGNSLSLFTVLEGLQAQVAGDPGAELRESGLPLQWEVVTFWLADAEELPLSLVVRLEIAGPDGSVRETHDTAFRMVKRHHKVRLRLTSFPAWESGDVLLRSSYRRGDSDAWAVLVEYPLPVTVRMVEPGAPESRQQ